MPCDASDVPLDSQSADRILSLEAMFHFPSRQTFLAEAARLLRAKGFLVCSDILFGKPRTDQESRMLDVVRHGYAPWRQPLLHSTEMKQMCAETGLTLRQNMDLSARVLPTWDQISSSREDPKRSPVAAMRDLHHAGLLHYPMYVLEMQ